MRSNLDLFSVVLTAALALGACSDSGNKIAPTCTGTSCTCPANASCDIGAGACQQQSCSVGCKDANQCTGTCGDSCSLECSGGSTCAITVGKSGSVTCAPGSTCRISCTGSCSLSCSGGATCELKCAADQVFTPVTGSGSCSL